MLGLSFVVQNLVDCERAAKAAVAHELEAARARLKKLEKEARKE